MALSILNSVSSLTAENALSNTQAALQKTLNQLSTGLRINSGSDDAAGLSIVNGMSANIAALTQSQQNASNGVGLLQTADGALSQVNTLLNRAITLATEASNSGITVSQGTALQTEFQSIQDEINQIGQTTNFNGQNVFGTTATVYLGDGKATGAANTTISTAISTLSSTALSLNTASLSTAAGAQSAVNAITTAIEAVSAQRGTLGASVNRLTSSISNMNNTVINLQSAADSLQNADIAKTVANMTQYNVLQSTGMSALKQSNDAQQAIMKLIQ